VVRFLLRDNALMAEKTAKVIATTESRVSIEVIAEAVYVLSGFYQLDRPTVASEIHRLFAAKSNLVIDSAVVAHGLDLFAATNMDFVDCILDGYAKVNGVTVFTFDKQLKTQLGVRSLFPLENYEGIFPGLDTTIEREEDRP
jgi:predicted nucleic-acid-binding protein